MNIITFLLTFKMFETRRELVQGKISGSRLASHHHKSVHHALFPRGFFMGRTLGGTSVRRFFCGGNAKLFRPAHQNISIFRAGSLTQKELNP